MELDKVITGCKAGDRQCQKLLFERYAKMFYAVSRRYTPVKFDPMDNMHDSFIKIFENIQSFDPDRGHFESWARRIVINNALQKMKKKSSVNEIYPEQFLDIQKDGFDVVSHMSAAEIYEIIEQLPDGYKQVFCLYEIEGYSHKEIGEMLGIQEVSSRSNLSRSKKLLQKMLLGSEHTGFQTNPSS